MYSSFTINPKRALLFLTLIVIPFLSNGQPKIKVSETGVVVTDNGQELPDASAVLDVSSSNKGVLFPQMTTATRDLIPSPSEGLLIYNSTKKVYEFFNGTEWLEMGVVSGSGGSGGSYDSDAQLVFDRMPTLTATEKTAINTFIVAEKAAGNYVKYDEFFLFPLGSTNGLIGFKSKTATANGGVTWDINGATFDGTGYINTGFNPSDGGYNYSLNNMIHEFFEKTAGTISGTKGQAGFSNANTGRSDFIYTGTLMLGGANSTMGTYNPIPSVGDNRLVTRARSNSTNVDSYLNGNFMESKILNSSSVPTSNFYLGAINVNGSPNYYYDGTISTYLVGAGSNFDHSTHNTNVRQLLTDLGVDLTPAVDPDVQAVYDRMPTLTASEKTAINDFILAEKAAGNYALYDEFFLFPLGATNGLIGFKSKTATANGGVTWGTDGATFDGSTGYIDTNWNPFSDGINYTQDDALHGGLVLNNVDFSTQIIWGAQSGGSQFTQFGILSSSTILSAVNSQNKSESVIILNKSLYTMSRISSLVNNKIYRDGSEIIDDSQTSGVPVNLNIYLGARNDNGVAGVFWDGALSTFIVGAGIGFDHSAHNTNVRQLLTDLGLTL